MSSDAIQNFEENETTRVVTPGDPLIIDEVAPTFDSVEIQGGQISTIVRTDVTFHNLIKTS